MFVWDRRDKMPYIGTLYEKRRRFMIVTARMQRMWKTIEAKMTSAYLKKDVFALIHIGKMLQ